MVDETTRPMMWVVRALEHTLTLLLPQECAGCGADGPPVCANCCAALPETVIQRRVGELRVISGAVWDERTAGILRALKEDGRTAVARALAPGLRRAVLVAARGRPAALVPVPGSAAALRRRGLSIVELLLQHARLPAVRMMRVSRRAADQRLLGRAAREANVQGLFRCVRPLPPGCAGVVIIDDVVTTGATLRAANAALSAAGIPVLGAATAVTTLRERRSVGTSGVRGKSPARGW